MRERIGDALVKKGLISAGDLEKAIQMQLCHGGTLGTNLIDLGLVTEEDLGRTLAEQLRVRYASPRTLLNIDTSVLSALPDSLAQKHKAVPIRREDRTLHLLVADPKNLSGLSSRTGYRIVPWIAPEVRVHQALEEHFGIPGDARRAKIWQRLDRMRAKPTSARRAAVSTAAVPRETPQDTGSFFEHLQSPPAFEQPVERAQVATVVENPAIDLPVLETEAAPGPRSLMDRLCNSNSPLEAVAAVMDHAAEQLRTCVLFRVRNETATIWDCRGLRLDAAARAAFRVPAHSGTPLELLTVYPSFRGPAPAEAAYRPFFAALGMALPAEMLLLPVKIKGRLVAILYGDAGATATLSGSADDYRELTTKLTLALSMVMLKRKIRD